MLSASGAVFQEHLFLPKSVGIIFAYSLIGLFLITGKKGLMFSYKILVPIKLILLLVIASYVMFFVQSSALETYTASLSLNEVRFWGISSVLYVSYNFALAMVILSEYQPLTNKRSGVAGGFWGGLILGLLVYISYMAMSKFLPSILHYEVPMLFIAGNISITAKHVYTLVLWLGILTTALANTYGFSQRMAKFVGLNFRSCLLISLTLAIPLSTQDFSVLVGKVYPLFGILGFVIVCGVAYKAIKDLLGELYYNIIKLEK
ncbi:MAG TPA: hypothetical protein VFC73_01095 [Syntrophomonadaceae bacterium]|nr:hypothetical protein [Syntrophomonadaceae bacterium]